MTATSTAVGSAVRRRRPSGRRDAILQAALELFVQHGYQATGIDEIGAAAQISGPAIYRHFASKQDLLEASFDRILETSRTEWDRILGTDASAEDKLQMFLDSTIRTTLDDRRVLTLFYREAQHLPHDRRRVIAALNHQLSQDWAGLLREVNPKLSEGEAMMAVDAVTNLVHTAARVDRGLSRARLERLLNDLAVGALEAILTVG